MAYFRFFVCSVILALFCSAAVLAQPGQPSIMIVSGNGLLVQSAFPTPFTDQPDALRVMVTDANGNPVNNARVDWVISTTSGSGLGSVNPTTFTDQTGKTATVFVGPQIFGQSFVQSVITATATVGSFTPSVSFTITTFGVGTLASLVGVSIQDPLLPAPISRFTGAAGQQGMPILVHVAGQIAGAQVGQGVQNVVVRIFPLDPAVGPSISCAGGNQFTDGSGNASCTPVFSGKVGVGTFVLDVGGLQDFTIPFAVTVGPPGIIKATSGDMQTANAGASLPLTLTAVITDLGGNPLSNIPVVFEPVVPNTATLANIVATSDANGRVSARVTLGNVSGTVQIRVRTADGVGTSTGTPIQFIFNETSIIPVGGIIKLSGDPQDAAVINSAFAQPLVVQVNDPSGKPVPGATVTFSVTSGSATLGASSVQTNAQGQASTTVRAGATAGPIVVTASVVGGFVQTFNLSARLPGPSCTPNSFANGANFQRGFISPGAIVTITCAGLASGIQGSIVSPFFAPLMTQLNKTTVSFGSVLAPIYNVSNIGGTESITVQMPFEVSPGTSVVTINVNGGIAAVNVPVQQFSPAIFETPMSDSKRRGVLTHDDGTFVTVENPARRGETVHMFVTGLGPLTPSVGTNQIGPSPGAVVNAPIIVGVQGVGAIVTSQIYATNLVGVYEVDFTVPDNVPSGRDDLLAIAVLAPDGTAVTGNGSLIPVQ